MRKDGVKDGRSVHQFASLFGGNLRAVPAPEPHDVQWENLEYTDAQRFLRSTIANVIILLLCALGTVTLIAANVITPSLTAESADPNASGLVKLLRSLGVWLGQTILIVFGHIVVIISTIVLANTMERHHTHGEKERTIMLKVSFFQVIDHIFSVKHTPPFPI